MPIIKSAKKKLKQDAKKTKVNRAVEMNYKKIIEKIKKSKKSERNVSLLKKGYSAIDKAVKKNVMHKNKGKRLKATLAKLLKK